MPTYVYACTECKHGFEVQQAFTDDALTECPNCDGRVRKVFVEDELSPAALASELRAAAVPKTCSCCQKDS